MKEPNTLTCLTYTIILFVKDHKEGGANNLKYARFDGMVADILSHSGKKVSIVKK